MNEPTVLPVYSVNDDWPLFIRVAMGGEVRTYTAKGKNGRPGKPVIRSDGKRYGNAMDAARSIIEEQGCGKVALVANNIRAVCKGSNHHKTAYGYGFRYEEER